MLGLSRRSVLLFAIMASLASTGAGCSAEDGVEEEDDDEGELRKQDWPSIGPGEVTGSVFVEPAPTSYERGRPGLVRYIVIHDIEGGVGGAVNTFRKAGAEVSAHYAVDYDGRIFQMVRERDIANHAYHSVMNAYAIGIEHAGYAKKPYAYPLYEASARAVAEIAKRYRIPLDRQHIIGHHQVPKGDEQVTPCPENATTCGGKGGHVDPGPAWNWPLYMDLVKREAQKIGYDSSKALSDALYTLQWVTPMQTLPLATSAGARPKLIGGYWATQCLVPDSTRQITYRTIFNPGEQARAESRYIQPRTTDCGVMRNGEYPLVIHGYTPEEINGVCVRQDGKSLKISSQLGPCSTARPECLTGPCPDRTPGCVTSVAFPAMPGECG